MAGKRMADRKFRRLFRPVPNHTASRRGKTRPSPRWIGQPMRSERLPMHSLMKGMRAPRLAAIAVGLSLLAACGGTTSSSGPAKASADKQLWRVNTETQPNSLDPGQQTYDYEGYVGRQLFE